MYHNLEFEIVTRTEVCAKNSYFKKIESTDFRTDASVCCLLSKPVSITPETVIRGNAAK